MTDLNDTTVLVAGASGMAGTAVCHALLDAWPGVRVRATHWLSQPTLTDPRVTYVRADLTTRQGCREAAAGCDMAILVAANTGGIASALSNPEQQVTDNLTLDAFLLEAMNDCGVQRCVYVSSATVYPPLTGYIREHDLDWNVDPQATYMGVGWAKRSAEKLCEFWHRSRGMSCIVLRAANIYGPGARFDPRRSNFLPALIRKATDGLDPFEVWGQPDVTRDVIYTADFAAAVLAAATSDIAWGTYNVGSGIPLRVDEAVTHALAAAGHSPSSIDYDTSAAQSVKHRVLDISLAAAELNWRPTISAQDGISATTRWWLSNRNSWTK